MRLAGGDVDLTYCTNIHPGHGWRDVSSQLAKYAPALKRRLSPDAPFGLGLRLSNEEAQELLAGGELERFAAFLKENGLYVSLLNGFPFGSFHGVPVKAEVFAPDWRDGERLAYTRRLIAILAALMLAGADGGVSTIPLSYKRWVQGDENVWSCVVTNLVAAVVDLVNLRANGGRFIHIDIEPEPDGLIETTGETIAFFEEHLLPTGGASLAEALGISLSKAREHLLAHVTVCFDTCHLAVEFEDVQQAISRFHAAGIRIGRIQISSAIRIPLTAASSDRVQLEGDLRNLAEPTYLHQVIERRSNGHLQQYPDLPDAISSIHDPCACEWRIHFHVPIFVESFGPFGSTQAQIRAALELVNRSQVTQHLEIETYTWGVLPSELKLDLLESIVREYEWVQRALSQ